MALGSMMTAAALVGSLLATWLVLLMQVAYIHSNKDQLQRD